MLSAPVENSKAVLEEMIGQRKEEAEDDDMDWDEEILGEMEGGDKNDRFSSYWNDDTEMTYPLILAKIRYENLGRFLPTCPLETGTSALIRRN